MRTKKFLSILLALVMTMGIGGLTVAYAEDANDTEAEMLASVKLPDIFPQDASFPPGSGELMPAILPQAAEIGWPDITTAISVQNRPDLADNRKDQAVLLWDAFTETTSGKGDGYFRQKTNNYTSRRWRVYRDHTFVNNEFQEAYSVTVHESASGAMGQSLVLSPT